MCQRHKRNGQADAKADGALLDNHGLNHGLWEAKNRLSNPCIKSIRWASDRLGESGIVCFVSDKGCVEGIAADGMRKHVANEFDLIYILDLGGNMRKNPKLSGTTRNVFGIQVGVSVNLFVRKSKETRRAGV